MKDLPNSFIVAILKAIFWFFPTQKQKIIFCNFNGKGIGDNPKYICNEIIRQKLPYDLVWLTKDKRNLPEIVRSVPFFSYKAIYEVSTAKVIVNNVKNGLPYIKKKGQYVIQTWHGEVALKLVEGENEKELSKSYVSKSKKDSKQTDIILAGSLFDYNLIRSAFWYDGKILKTGMPRNDIFFKSSDSIKRRLKNAIGVSEDVKVVMYAPTFRDNGDVTCYDLDQNRLIRVLTRKTGKAWVLLLRMHPNVNVSRLTMPSNNGLINVSTYPDPQELILISDLLITDYSSISIDAIINKVPVIIYASDLEKYRKGRGLRPLYFELPFQHTQSNEELMAAIENFDRQAYWQQANQFMTEKVVSFDDGHASEQVVKIITHVIDGVSCAKELLH